MPIDWLFYGLKPKIEHEKQKGRIAAFFVAHSPIDRLRTLSDGSATSFPYTLDGHIAPGKPPFSRLAVGNEEGWSLDEKQTVGGRDAATEPTGMFSRRVCARPDSRPC